MHTNTHDPATLFDANEPAALGLAVSVGLPWADLVLEVGFGAGQSLFWRIANGWWPNTRHIAIDPLPIYAAQIGHLAHFGVTWVQAAASDHEHPIPFYQDSHGLMGTVLMPGTAIPSGWAPIEVPVTTLDAQYHHFRHHAQAIWVRIDCPSHVAAILRGARDTLLVADLLTVVLNLADDPMALATTFQLVEAAGLRCFRLTDWHYAADTGQLLSVTIIFVRLEKMPQGMAQGTNSLDPVSLARTYEGLDHRRAEHIARLEALVAAHSL